LIARVRTEEAFGAPGGAQHGVAPTAGGPRRPRRRGLAWAAVLGGMAGLAVALVLSSLPRAAVVHLHGSAVWAPGHRAAPGFALRDQAGRQVSLGDVRGHLVLLGFMDSRCTRACPVEGRLLRRAEQALPQADRPVLMIVSVNPADTAASARRFAEKSGFAGLAPWHWLMGARTALARVWRSYGVGVRPTPGDIEHSTVLYLIDSRGDERAAYGVPFLPSSLASDIRSLERESHGAWHWPWS
jgi:protein SCO1/2